MKFHLTKSTCENVICGPTYANDIHQQSLCCSVLQYVEVYSSVSNDLFGGALMRVMRAAVYIPAVASASVLHSAAVSGSVEGDVGPL